MDEIKKIAIIGVGLMGGSFSLAVKEKFKHIQIWGYARNRTSYEKLNKLNIVDKIETDLEKLVNDADMVVLATPVCKIIDYLKKIARFLKKGSIVFDLGSTKQLIVKAAKEFLPKYVSFVGCHPLCGSQNSGANFSNSKLYQGSICIVTTSTKNHATTVVKNLWEAIGAKVIFINPDLHDKIFSFLSHLPHILAFSLINFVPKKYLGLAPQSFKDLTRISGSPPFVWSDIFLTNRYLEIDLENFIKILEEFRKILQQKDRKKILAFIRKANKRYSLLWL